MAQSDARFGYRAKLKREDHDLSRPFGFTAAPGMLLPIFADIATPGDSYYIKHDLTFLRTAPLAAPAMVDVKVHFESFFVPAQMVLQPFENIMFSLNWFQSTNFDGRNLTNNSFPLWDYSTFVTNVMTNYQRDKIHADSFRIADMLDLNADNFAYDSSNPSRYSYKPSFFPWQLLAYHTIYQYYYRLDDKSQFDASNCNWDSSFGSASAVGATQYGLTEIHQRPWKFDYFTSMYRSPIVSDANLQSVMPGGTYQVLMNNNNGSPYTTPMNDSGQTIVNSEIKGFSNGAYSNYNQSLQELTQSTVAIRQMFANEKLAMITGRTRKTYDSQVLAHFGVEVPHDVKHDITLIGRDSYPVHIGEVTSLASTTDAGLGDLAGKGWSQSPDDIKTHKFTAPCHGFVITIFSVEPEQRYFGGFNKINTLATAFDIPTPEFDRLGNMPMFRYEAGSKTLGMTDTDIIGWKERYYYNKRRSPKTTLGFANANQGYVGTNSYQAYMITSQPFGNNNRLPNVGRPDLEENFYIPRGAMDALMLVSFQEGWIDGTGTGESENWNVTPWLAYARDPFIIDSFEKVKKVSWMSKDGEPIYDF